MMTVSVPVLGIIFLSLYFCRFLSWDLESYVSVPVLGIIFLSYTLTEFVDDLGKFPSPYWGLFFYRKRYVFSDTTTKKAKFPSPYWGLFFYPIIGIGDINGVLAFPSPYWGLFFYRHMNQTKEQKHGKYVSVPVLGIIFLSYSEWYSILLDDCFVFPSPYWGLFFYRHQRTTTNGITSW